VLNGKAGNDTLTGGLGDDIFRFDTALGAANVDRIKAFDAAHDSIEIGNAIFKAFAAPGAVSAGAFHIGAAAADAGDRIVYDSATGALSYDSDGTGAAAAVTFATLDKGLALTAQDFWIV